MPDVYRMRVAWNGDAVVGPGLTTFFFLEVGGGQPAAVTTFFTSIKSYFPSGVQWAIPNSGDAIDEATGVLTGTWSTGTAGSVAGSSAGSFTQGVGARVVWRTPAIRGGRRVRGSTFMVPLLGSAYDTQGTIATAVRTAVGDAAGALLTASNGNLAVYSRPRPGLSGQGVAITAFDIPDRVSWLRSRRT